MQVATDQSQCDLWQLALQAQWIDPAVLEFAIEQQLLQPSPDFRTRLLIRDSLSALRSSLGNDSVDRWLMQSPFRADLDKRVRSELGPTGFPSLAHRIMQPTKFETVQQLLRELGMAIGTPTRLVIGGSIALIMANVLSRRTEHIDVVDEVPAAIRSQHELLDGFAKRYGLHLTHFQSHYLPSRWETRLRSLGIFGKLEVMLIDPCDIFLSKLFSNREKDRDDLRAMAGHFDRAELIQRLKNTTESLRKEPALCDAAEKNWYILFGDTLPA